MTTADRRIATNTTGQLGSFTRAQGHEAGLTDRQLRSRVQSGILDKSGAQTYRTPHGPTGAKADLQALVLDVGEPCWVSGPTAAALHGLDGFALRPPFHVTVLRGRWVNRAGHEIHTTLEVPLIDRAEVDGIPVFRGARTIIDLARFTDAAKLTAALDAALRDGLMSEASLHTRIAALRTKGRYGIPKLLDVISGSEVTRGAHSWLEREFLRLLGEARLPVPTCQEVLTRARDRVVRVDCRFPGTNLVVELLGYRFHRTKEQMQRDVDRANALALQGYVVVQFTYEDIVCRGREVVETVMAALRSVSAQTTTDVVCADTEAAPGGVRGWWARRPSQRGRRPS